LEVFGSTTEARRLGIRHRSPKAECQPGGAGSVDDIMTSP